MHEINDSDSEIVERYYVIEEDLHYFIINHSKAMPKNLEMSFIIIEQCIKEEQVPQNMT